MKVFKKKFFFQDYEKFKQQLLNVIVSSKVSVGVVENIFWVEFLRTNLPQFPIPRAAHLIDTLEAALLHLKEEMAAEGLLPLAIVFAQKMVDHSLFFIAVGMTRKNRYYFLKSTVLEETDLSADHLHQFCADSLDVAFVQHKLKITCVIVDLIEMKCDEFFIENRDVEYIVTPPLYKIINVLKRVTLDDVNVIDEGNSSFNKYGETVKNFKKFLQDGKCVGESFAKLVELIEGNSLEANNRWVTIVLPFVNPLTLGSMFMLPSQKTKVESDEFLKELRSFANITDLLRIFYYRTVPRGDATKYFALYKDGKGEFPFANEHFMNKGARYYWDQLQPIYFGLCEFALDLMMIPVAPRTVDLVEMYHMMSTRDFDMKNSYLTYKILLHLRTS